MIWQPPPAVEGGGLQLELTQQEAVVLTEPPTVTNQTESSQDLTISSQDSTDVNMAAPASSGGGLKRPFTSSIQTSSSSERSSSASPMGAKSDTEFSVVRGRNKGKKKRGVEAAQNPRAASGTPLASPAPPRSSLEDVILQPRMEVDANTGSTTCN